MRLQHAALPEAAREADRELRALLKEKDAAVRAQDFEKAGGLRDREMELKAQISAITSGAKDEAKAEVESGEGGGPVVTEEVSSAASLSCQSKQKTANQPTNQPTTHRQLPK